MNQPGFSTIAIALIIAAALLIGGSALMMKNFIPAEPTASQIKEAEKASSPSVIPSTTEQTSTFEDIITRGQTLECDWKVPAETAAPFNTGKLWTTRNQGRSTINTDINGIPMEAHAIYPDNTVYSWIATNDMKMGFKFAPNEIDNANNNMTQQQRQQAEQIRREMIFDCKPWTVDNAKFVLPADVEFRTTL